MAVQFKDLSYQVLYQALHSLPLGDGENLSDLELTRYYMTLKVSAEKRDIHFGLTLKRVRQLLRQKCCAYTGVPFDQNVDEHKRTMDRIDNELGYTDDNVIMVCKRINKLKSNMTVKELKGIVMGITKREKKLKTKAKLLKNKVKK